MLRTLFAITLATALLPAQTTETVGGTNAMVAGSNRGKASLYAVDQTVVLTEFEVFLDVPPNETLTFFAHRHHSRTGTATLAWSLPVTVAGGGGPLWWSTGPIAMPLVAGNYYTLGVSWAGVVTYFYSTASTGAPVSFGSWQRAHTTSNPPPTTLVLPAGVDVAQYHQRLTTIATPAVVDVGTGCNPAGLAPRLVATGLFRLNSSEGLELVDAAANSVAVHALANGGALAAPLPLFGCSLWLDVFGGYVTLPALTSAAGYHRLTIPIPNNAGLVGAGFAGQSVVLGPTTTVTNAVAFTIVP